jgi:type II secretory pathway pseudopilin PulG
MKVRTQTRRGSRNPQQGYILLTLLLIVAMMIIFAAAIVPSIAFDMKRDREEEMIHRGCQYSRAIRAYYRKFGRYPVKLEDLENTNDMRFLRKRYKDPMNCKNGKCADFKLLHFGEVQMALGMGGGQIVGATPVSQMGQGNGQSSFGQSSTFGNSSAFGSSSSFGSSANSPAGQGQTTFNSSGTDSSQSQVSADGTTGNASASSDNSSDASSSSSSGSPQIIGGPIIGVASLSKDKTIRVYNKKKVYKDWAFVYDPTLDQGLLITTPYQPSLQSFNTQTNLNGQNGQNPNGQNGTTGSGFGNSFGSGNGFGSSFGNSSQTGSSNGGFGQPSNPNPPQQQ